MPASGNKNLEVVLNYRDKLSGKAPQTIKALLGIEKQATRTVSAVEKLNKALGLPLGGKRAGGGSRLPDYLKPLRQGAGLTRQIAAEAGRGLKLETQQARLLREQTKLRGDGARLARDEARAVEALARSRRASVNTELADVRLTRERLKLQRDTERIGARRRGPWRERVENFNAGVRTARNVRDVAGATIDTVRGFTDPALKEMRSEQRFRMMGFSPDENREAFGAVDKTVAEVKGVRRGDVIESLTGLINTFGDVNEAKLFLPITAKYRANMEAMFGDLYSPEDVTRQINNTFKAMEVLGFDRPTGPKGADGKPTFSEADRARMENRFQLVARATAATGGEINPQEFRHFAKYSRLGGLGLSEEGLTNMLPIVGQLGGSTTGQSLMRVYSALSGGVMKDEHKREWERLGLRDSKTGRIGLADKFKTNPLAAADELAGVLSSKAGVDTKDFNSVNGQLVKMFGNQNALGLVAQMINFQAGIGKEIDKNARALDINATYKDIFERQNPLGQFLDYRATETNARAAAGRKPVELGGTIAEQLTKAIDYVRSTTGDNSAFSVATVGILSLGKASAEAADGVGLLGKITGGATGAGGGAGAGGGGWLGTGYGTGDILGGGFVLGKGLKWGGGALGRGALTLGSAVAGAAASPYVATALALTAGGVGLYTRNRAVKANEAADGARAGLFESAGRLREQSGGRLPDQIARSLGSTAFEQLNRAGDLTTKLEPGLYGAYQRVYDPSAYRGWMRPFDGERASGVFKQRAPELAFPEVMRAFVADVTRRVGAGQISPEAGQRTLKTAEAAWPESFKTATAEAASGLAKLPEPATQTGKALADILTPSRSLPASLSHLGGSLDSLAARVNGLEIRVPSIVLPPVGGATGGAAGGKTKSGYKLGIDPLNIYPPSAVGSVVERDGLAEVHRGNTIFPASLSRRRPGDWLESAEAIGGMGEGAGVPDYSQFATSGGGAQITVHVGDINVTGGADARETGAAVATEVERQVREVLARLAALESDVYDPRFVANMTARELNWQRERA